MRKRAGFALAELITVLAIIGILLAIVLPAIVSVKKNQMQALCLTNIQHIHQATTLYLADYDGNYPLLTAAVINAHGPSAETWVMSLAPYANKQDIGHCPLVADPELGKKNVRASFMTGYAMNMLLNAPTSRGQQYTVMGRAEASIQIPPMTVLIAECRPGILGVAGPDAMQNNVGNPGIYDLNSLESIRAKPAAAYRHENGANYGFVDGHAKWLRPLDFRNTQSTENTPGFILGR